MMAEETKITKNINTRIRLKYDSCANWIAANPTLLSGEIAIAYLGPTRTETEPDNGTHPVLFKVGPGAFNDLPWASALAADVYEWAKKNGVHASGDGNAVTAVGIDEEGYLAFNKGETFATIDELYTLGDNLGERLDNITDTNTTYRFEIKTDDEMSLVKTLKVYSKNNEEPEVLDNSLEIISYELLDAKMDRGGWNVGNTYFEGWAGDAHIDLSPISISMHTSNYEPRTDIGHSYIDLYKETFMDQPKAKTSYKYGQILQIEEKLDDDGQTYEEINALTLPEKSGTIATIDDITLENLGLTGPMNFRGKGTASIDENGNIVITVSGVEEFITGDVVITNAGIEYVYDGSKWHELGNESSHALKSIKIEGTGYLTGGGDLTKNRTIDIKKDIKDKIDAALPANGWETAQNYLGATETESGDNYNISLSPRSVRIDTSLGVDHYTELMNGSLVFYSDITDAYKSTRYGINEIHVNHIDDENGPQGGTLKLPLQSGTLALREDKISADNFKSSSDYTGADAEVWVFNCGSATELIN